MKKLVGYFSASLDIVKFTGKVSLICVNKYVCHCYQYLSLLPMFLYPLLYPMTVVRLMTQELSPLLLSVRVAYLSVSHGKRPENNGNRKMILICSKYSFLGPQKFVGNPSWQTLYTY